MRNTIHNALANAREIIGKTTANIQQGNTLSEDEQLQRYVLMHRGNPLGTAQFISQNMARIPDGTNPLTAWRNYESKMEELLKARGM